MSHRTYRTRCSVSESTQSALSEYARVFGSAMRTLHARAEAQTKATGRVCRIDSFKNAALKEFGLTGRQFNALEMQLEGKRDSVREGRKLNIEDLRDRIGRLDSAILGLQESLAKGRYSKDRTQRRLLTHKQRKVVLFTIHQKSRRRAILQLRLTDLISQEASHQVSMCFGSRRLFHAQFRLEDRGYASHEEWLAAWRAARDNQFVVLGSKGEMAGCQGCVAKAALDGSLSLRIRLPSALVGQHGTHAEVHGVRFAYGHDQVLDALRRNELRRVCESQARAEANAKGEKFSEKNVEGGIALTWQFVRDSEGWQVFVAVEAVQLEITSSRAAGRVAVDVNADHLAVAETDHFGNCIKAFSVPCRTRGLSTNQAGAVIGDAVKAVIAHVASVRKPLVLERLDFRAKKRSLGKDNPAYARMLSSFAYGRIRTLFEARALDAGIEVLSVNPAYTSVIGRIKYSVPLGITTHEAAAVAIARRSQQVRERAPQPGKTLLVPVKGGVTAWTSPAWTKPQHRAHPWRRIAREPVRPCERALVREDPAVRVSGRKRLLTLAGETALPSVRA
ncbi:transposase [Ramlibacter alkalitolerans]|nr:transposase [Ramlibacter alkalitolerans]